MNLWNDCLETCECFRNYDKNERLKVNFEQENWHLGIYPIFECNSECGCVESCENRVVQKGPKFSFEIIDCGLKGKGLRTLEFIPKGSFVVEYMGEIIGLDIAKSVLNQRSNLLEPNYIMYLKEYYSDKRLMQTTVIDARNYSNHGRFINHSCDPNLFILPVRIDNMIPHAALFSLRDISSGEELSYDYNNSVGSEDILQLKNSNKTKLTKCLCESFKCKGFLPDFE